MESKVEMSSVFLYLENLFVLYVEDMVNIYAMRQMMMSVAWSAKMNFWKFLNSMREPPITKLKISPMTKLKISPHLKLEMPYQLLSLAMIPGIIIGTAGQKRDLVFLLMNVGNVKDLGT